MLKWNIQTPWGVAETAEKIADGIMFYSTPSHGGFYLSDARMAEMPTAFKARTFIKPPRGEAGRWYEEDCDAAMVAVAFPQYFTPENIVRAKEAVKRWQPEAWAQFVGPRLCCDDGQPVTA